MPLLELLEAYNEHQDDQSLAGVLMECSEDMKKWKARALRKFGRHLTEQEIEQEILRGTVSVIQKFDLSKADGRDITALFYSYATQRALGSVHDYFDSKARFDRETTNTLDDHNREHEWSLGQVHHALGIEALDDVEEQELWRILFRILRSCKPKERLTFLLVFWEGWTQAEVAKYFGFTEAWAALQMKAAISYLKRSRTFKKYVNGAPNCTNVSKTPTFFIIPVRPTCSAKGCEKKPKSRGRCYAHRTVTHERQCKASGCGSVAELHGYCRKHNRRVKLYGSTEGRQRVVNEGNTCLKCHENPAERMGLCGTCYSLQQYYRRAESGYFDQPERRAKLRMYAKRQYLRRKATGFFETPEFKAKQREYNRRKKQKKAEQATLIELKPGLHASSALANLQKAG